MTIILDEGLVRMMSTSDERWRVYREREFAIPGQDGPGLARWMRVYDGECELKDFRTKSIDLGFGDPWPTLTESKFKSKHESI